MRNRLLPTLIAAVSIVTGIATGPTAASAAGSGVPFDEETLDRIGALNRAISEHYEELQNATLELDSRRSGTTTRLEAIEQELETIDVDLRQARRRSGGNDHDPGVQIIEEHRIEAKSRYLEALAEKHEIDVETTRSFELHASAILRNLERLAEALEASGQASQPTDDAETQRAFHSLQRGTAIALSVLEQWGALGREDPRFRALWATSRVLNRNVNRVRAADGIKLTVDLVRERTFVVRSLIDQARALRAALDQQGLLLQVAAQNQMLRLHFTRLGAINGLELPDLYLEETTQRIIADIEEEPFEMTARADDDGLSGFDDCATRGECR